MPLELQQPEDLYEDARPILTLAACDEHEDACRRCVDGFVTREREQAPDEYRGLPFATHRLTFTRGEPDVIAAKRLLKQELQQ